MKQPPAKQNDLKKTWHKAFQEVLLRQSESRFTWLLVMFVDFLSIAGSLLLMLGCWIWWRSDVLLIEGLMWASISLLMHLIMAYETGYKLFFCDGQKRYFYLVWLVPVLLSVVGFIGGLFYRGIL